MKKLFLFLILSTFGCDLNSNHNHSFVVERISEYKDRPGFCTYQIQSYNIAEFDLIDSIGKFNIGDTLTLKK